MILRKLLLFYYFPLMCSLLCVAWLSNPRTQLFGPYPRWGHIPAHIEIHISVRPVLVAFSKKCIVFLRSLLEKIEQETWRETGISFVTSVTRLVERLLDYRYAGVKAEIDNFLTFSPASVSLWYPCWHRCCEETPLAKRPPWAPWLLSKAINNWENPNLTWRTWSHCYKKAE